MLQHLKVYMVAGVSCIEKIGAPSGQVLGYFYATFPGFSRWGRGSIKAIKPPLAKGLYNNNNNSNSNNDSA